MQLAPWPSCTEFSAQASVLDGEDAGALSSSAVVGCTTRTERSREEQQLWGFHGSQRAVHDYSEQGCALVGLCLSMCEVGVRAGASVICNGRVRARVWVVVSQCELVDPR